MCVCVGEDSEKGKVLGIIRSIGALGRAFGPFVACTGKTLVLLCVVFLRSLQFTGNTAHVCVT